MLIAYFSWSGNVKLIAEKIHGLVGGDVFEITPVAPYSRDYRECLVEANAHRKANAEIELASMVPAEAMAKHKVVFVGYPNWLQALPMPVVSFLKACDWTGKMIMPFCSHGGGRLGQSEAELAKLCPKAKIARAISVFKGGGDTLGEYLNDWLGGVGGETA
jgi:flavodoxin